MIIYDPKITGSFQVNGSTVTSIGEVDTISGSVAALNAATSSYALSSSISGSFTSLSASLSTRLTDDEGSITSLNAASSSYLLNTTDTLTGDLTVTGTITAQEFHTEYVSGSIIYTSGSTKFGDSYNDVHEFTGSVNVTNSTGGVTGSYTFTGGNFTISGEDADFNLNITSGSDIASLTEIRFQTDGGNMGRLYMHKGTKDMYLGPTFFSTSSLYLQDGTGTVMSITGSSVGIGTTAPQSRLHTYASNDRAAIRIQNTAASKVWEITPAVPNISNSGLSIHNFTDDEVYLHIANDGSVGIGTTSPETRLGVNAGGSNGFSSGTLPPGVTIYGSSINGYGTMLSFKPATGDQGVAGIGSFRVSNYTTDLRFYTNNTAASNSFTERMRIDSNGNVGIGETNPSSYGKLVIKNDTSSGAGSSNASSIWLLNSNTTSNNASSIFFGDTGTAAAGAINFINTDHTNEYGEISFDTRGSGGYGERMRIDSSGNIRIGPSTTSSQIDFNYNNVANKGGFSINYSTGEFKYYAGEYGNTYYKAFFTNSTEKMRIQADGAIRHSFNPGSGTYYWQDVTNSASMFYLIPATYVGTAPYNKNRIVASNSSHIAFETGGSERMTIDSNGFITTNPSANIQGALFTKGVEYSIKSVGSQSGYTQGAILLSSGTDSVPAARGQGTFLFNEGNDITWYIGGLYNNTDRIDFCRKTGTTSVDTSTAQTTYSLFNFNSSGQAANSTGTWGTISSDQRLKENIVDATPKLDDVISLQVRNFNYIGKEEKYIGFIAQELEQVFPSLVTTNDMREFDRDGNVIGGLEDTKGVKVGMDFAILVKAIQEQQAIIEDLKARIETLENA